MGGRRETERGNGKERKDKIEKIRSDEVGYDRYVGGRNLCVCVYGEGGFI